MEAVSSESAASSDNAGSVESTGNAEGAGSVGGAARALRVLVTGASGFVGSYTVAALLNAEARYEVRALVRDPGKAAKVLARLGVDVAAVEFVAGDMLDPAVVDRALDGCDAAIHAAAAIGITGAAAGDLIETNVTGTRNVVGGAVARGLDPVVHVSTIAVFVPPGQPVITADGPLARPRTEYGRSKVAAEQYVRGLQDDGGAVTIVYPAGVCGPEQPVLDALNKGLAGGLGQMWPYPPRGGVPVLDVRDLAEALCRCVEKGQGARRWLLGGHFLPWAQLIDQCDALTGVRCRRAKVPAWVMLGIGSTLDAAKRIKHFEFPLTRDAAEMMITMVATDDRPMLDALDLKLRPVEETLTDTLRWLAAEGHLAAAKAGNLAD